FQTFGLRPEGQRPNLCAAIAWRHGAVQGRPWRARERPDHRRPLGEIPMTTLTLTRQPADGVTADERPGIFPSPRGTAFECYAFYLYAPLAPFFAALFFPPGNDTAALLSAFATYAAGFLVRPFGALIFGRIGDLVGRKYTFLVTIVVMGGATFAVGLLPTFSDHTLPF